MRGDDKVQESSFSVISLFSLSSDLFPYQWRYNPNMWGTLCFNKDIQRRLQTIGTRIINHDISLLQNVCRSGAMFLNNFAHSKLDTFSSEIDCSSEWPPLSSIMWNPYILCDKCCVFTSWKSNLFSLKDKEFTELPSNVSTFGLPVQAAFLLFDVTSKLPNLILGILTVEIPRLVLPSFSQILSHLREMLVFKVWELCVHHLLEECLCYTGNNRNSVVQSSLQSYVPGRPIDLSCCGLILMGNFGVDPYKDYNLYRALMGLNDTNENFETGATVILRDLFEPSNNPAYNRQRTFFTVEADRKNHNLKATYLQQKRILKEIVSRTGGNSLCQWKFHGRTDHIFSVDEITISSLKATELTEKLFLRFINDTSKNQEEHMKRFELIRAQLPSSCDDPYPLLIQPARLISFETNIITEKYTEELSSHWGISCLLGVNNNSHSNLGDV